MVSEGNIFLSDDHSLREVSSKAVPEEDIAQESNGRDLSDDQKIHIKTDHKSYAPAQVLIHKHTPNTPTPVSLLSLSRQLSNDIGIDSDSCLGSEVASPEPELDITEKGNISVAESDHGIDSPAHQSNDDEAGDILYHPVSHVEQTNKFSVSSEEEEFLRNRNKLSKSEQGAVDNEPARQAQQYRFIEDSSDDEYDEDAEPVFQNTIPEEVEEEENEDEYNVNANIDPVHHIVVPDINIQASSDTESLDLEEKPEEHIVGDQYGVEVDMETNIVDEATSGGPDNGKFFVVGIDVYLKIFTYLKGPAFRAKLTMS